LFEKRKHKNDVDSNINEYKENKKVLENRVIELAELLGNTKKLILKNFISGVFKGFGISIGFSLFSAALIYLLQKIIRLNIPIISEYIMDIIDIVEKNH